MARERMGMHRLQELVRLHRQGVGCREGARLLSMSPNTERMYRQALIKAGLWDGPIVELPSTERLRAAVLEHLPSKPAEQNRSTAEKYRDSISKMLASGARPQSIFDRLRTEESDFSCSASAVKRFCQRLRRERGVQPQDVAIPVVSFPGEVAQIDFGYVGKLYDPVQGRLRKAWVFVMTLAYSRRSFTDIVFDQETETFIRLHQNAFKYFGGVPKVVVPDNLKSAVIRAAFNTTQTTELNRSYTEAARHYGFKIDPTPAYSPEKKGIVESDVGYVKNNFFAAHRDNFVDIDDARRKLARWMQTVADQRIHGTTRERPIDRFERDEKPALLPLPKKAFTITVWKQATVYRDSHVKFDHRLYSVPYRLIGQKVWIRVEGDVVTIYADDVRVATHNRAKDYRSTQDEHLPEERRALRYRSQSHWEERARRIGPETLEYVRQVFAQKHALYQLRNVQRIVCELSKVPHHRAESAAKRALYFQNFSPTAVGTILKQGLDQKPWEDLMEPSPPTLSFVYQRSLDEILRAHLAKEAHHVVH